jgi:hypothetical protein
MGERFERNGEKKMKQLYELSRKFPKDWIKKAPKGKFGNYVPHPVITQRLLEVCGPESDSFKRCAMKLGLGLHLWAGEEYYLDKQLDKKEVGKKTKLQSA